MAVRMIAPFKNWKIDQVVTPEDDLEAWLVSRKYAVPVEESEIKRPTPGKKKPANRAVKGRAKK